MPTHRARHVVTETDDVIRALDDAAAAWPADRERRAKLVLRLLEEGHRSLMAKRVQADGARRDAIARTSGVLTGAYGEDYLTTLREDWRA
jgi:hypothetical protein